MTAEEWNTHNPVGKRVCWGNKSIRRYKDGSVSISLKEYSRRTIGPAVMTEKGLKAPVRFKGKKEWVPVS